MRPHPASAVTETVATSSHDGATMSASAQGSPDSSGRRVRLPTVSPTVLGYLVGPIALVVILVLMHFGLVTREPWWLWIGVFAIVPTTGALVDHVCRRRPTRAWIHIRVVQNVAAVTAVIYLSGWGPVLVLAFAFVALENISHEGSRLWPVTALWSVMGIAVGQVAVSESWAPSVLSTTKANTLAVMGTFVLLFVIRMAGAVMEQKETAETTMRRSEDRFRSLIQDSKDVTVVVNNEGLCTYVSPSVVQMLGFEPSELVGRATDDFVHEDDKERVASRISSNTAINSESVSLQFRMYTKSGHVRLVEAVVSDQRSRPSVSGFVGHVRDITERSKAAEELQRSQESFRVLFEQHPHPMWVYDLETLRFLEVNQCAVENYGYSRDEFLSMSIADIRPDEDAPTLMKYMHTKRPHLNHAGVWRHRTKSGDVMDVEVTTHTLDFRGHRSSLVMAQDVTERCLLEQQLQDHALHNPLTGLPNRALLLDRVDRLNAQARRSNADVTVLCLNLDNFKLVNEAHGHEIGDGLIRAVGDRLVNALRDADTVGRVAGDEFVILAVAPMLDAQPEALATKVLDLIGSQPFHIDGHELSVTTSIGIAVGNGREGAELIQNADVALGLARDEGGNAFVVFAREMQAAVDERVQMTMDLRHAVLDGQFETFYQPLVRVKDLSVVGVEALVRWHHPTLGLVPPVQFIPLAEETGLITDIGRLVLGQACEQAKLWQRSHDGLTVAVNVSAFQLRSDDFIQDVRSALEESGLKPENLVLEVTESILINNPAAALERLQALKEFGVRLALDDFGTGYSSLSSLRQLPFDIVKIDQSFIAAMVDSRQGVAMVQTMIQMGRQLKLEVIAEGVELQQQLDLLRRLHCQDAQGYLFSRPLDAETITTFLTDWAGDRTSELQGTSPAVPVGRLPQRSTVGAPS